MKTAKLLLCLLMVACFWGCLSEGEPSEMGQVLTEEQIAQLPGDDSWNGKLVAVKGYPSFAKKVIKSKSRNLFSISATPESKGLINANIYVENADKEGTTLFGSKPRNLVKITTSNLDVRNATFITDDYAESGYKAFIFSGTLVYDQGNVYLDKVSIHEAE